MQPPAHGNQFHKALDKLLVIKFQALAAMNLTCVVAENKLSLCDAI